MRTEKEEIKKKIVKLKYENYGYDFEETEKASICESCGKNVICLVPVGTEEKDSCSPVCKQCLEKDGFEDVEILRRDIK